MFRLGLNNKLITKSTSLIRNSSILNTKNLVITATQRSLHTTKTAYGKITYINETKGESDILVQQRKLRPISPHLTIYQPQLTWYLSSVHRLTLILLGLTFYCGTILFGLSSIFGLQLSTDKLTNWYHNKYSKLTQFSFKTLFAYLFAFQYTLAIRHLIWDTAKELTLKGVYRTGYAAIAGALAIGSYLLTL